MKASSTTGILMLAGMFVAALPAFPQSEVPSVQSVASRSQSQAPEVIEEITPDTLARLAAVRKQREQEQAAGSSKTVASPASAGFATDAPTRSVPNVPTEAAPLAQPTPSSTALPFGAVPHQAFMSSSGSSASALVYNPVTASRTQAVNFIAYAGMKPTRFPYSTGDKFRLFIRDTYDPYNLAAEGFNALYNQARGTPYRYGGGIEGYERRVGGLAGTDFAGEFFGTFLFPSVLHTDPRYFRKAQGGFGHRAVYALTRILITRKDSGGNTFNLSHLLASLAATSISNTYYPGRDRHFGSTAERTGINIGFDATTDLFREFWPEIAHVLHIPPFVIRRTADPMFPAANPAARTP